jgi:pilus assembly protein Flp/PilA
VTFREIHEERRLSKMLFAPKEKGQGLVEYALILVLVAIVVIAALMILGPLIGNVFSTINSSLGSF